MVGHTRTNSSSQNISFSSGTIGEYILGKTLGEGSCAIVKLGTHITTGKQVAVKIIKPNSLQEQKEVLREVESLQVLKGGHPHIIKLVQSLKEGGYTCLILELAEGGELFNYIVDSGRLKEEEARRIFRQVVSGVLYSHAHLVVHRDLKPENIILDAQNNVKVTDFGLSNILKPGMLFSTFCGSPVYTSPEVVLHKQYNGTIADVWSLGAVLYVMVTGGMPWRLEQNAVKNMDQLLAANFRLPDSLGLSEGVKDLIRKMLTADCRERATLETVARHPWLSIGYEGPPKAYLKAKPLVAADRINENVLEHLLLLGMDITKAREDITKDPHCPALTAYHSLLDKHMRACRVVTDYNTVSASDVSDSPNSSPTRSRAKSDLTNDKPKLPMLNKIHALRGSDPLASRPSSPSDRDRCSSLSMSANLEQWDYNRYTESPVAVAASSAHPSSLRVPRRSVELRDLFSAPSMPSTDTMSQLRCNDLLPNIPLVEKNPFADFPDHSTVRPRAPPPASLTGPLNSYTELLPMVPVLSPNPFAFDEILSSTSPTATSAELLQRFPQSAPGTPDSLLFSSRTDSPNNILSSPYIPPVTNLSLSGSRGSIYSSYVTSSPVSSTLVLATPEADPATPDTPRRASPVDCPFTPTPTTTTAIVTPTPRRGAFKGFLDIFRPSRGTKSAPSTPVSCSPVSSNSPASPATGKANPTSPKMSSKKGSALKFNNNSPTAARRSLFLKN